MNQTGAKPDTVTRIALIAIAVVLAAIIFGAGWLYGRHSTGIEDLEERLADAKSQVSKNEDEIERLREKLQPKPSTHETENEEVDEFIETIPGSGTFHVGDDVQAGNYRNDGSEFEGAPCVAYTSAKPNDLVNGVQFSNSQGPGTITLKGGQWFTTEYCQPWRLDGRKR
jgi:hypothetical protein